MKLYDFDNQKGEIKFNNLIYDIINNPSSASWNLSNIPQDQLKGLRINFQWNVMFEDIITSTALPLAFRNLKFSPNDSFIYAFGSRTWYNGNEGTSIQVNVVTGKANVLKDIGGRCARLNHLGQMMITQGRECGWLITNPNNSAPNLKIEPLEFGRLCQATNDNQWFTPNTSSYFKLDFTPTLYCNGKAKLKLNAAMVFEKFVLVINNKDTIKTTATEISISNLKQGKNEIKLLGYTSGKYFQAILHVVDVPMYMFKPIAFFQANDTLGCQWVNSIFINRSAMNYMGQNGYFKWQFGDGSIDSTNLAKAKGIVNHVYTTSGLYSASLIANNGFCADTFLLNKKIDILPAPRPGFSQSDSVICTPMDIRFMSTYPQNSDSIKWHISNGDILKGITVSTNFPKAGFFVIDQALYGSTGCVTHAKKTIEVKQGVDMAGMPEILNASYINNQQIEIVWKPMQGDSLQYQVFNDGNEIGQTRQTSLRHDIKEPLQTLQYQVKAIDFCNQESLPSEVSTPTQLLSIKEAPDHVMLHWRGYQGWQNAINEIEVWEAFDSSTTTLKYTLSGSETDCIDWDFYNNHTHKRCYRVFSKNNEIGFTSKSNFMCFELKPMLFIPTAFSPNGDDINDTWHVGGYGIEKIHTEIYNVWGALMADLYEPVWDGMYLGQLVLPGVYLYRIQAVMKDGSVVEKDDWFMVLK